MIYAWYLSVREYAQVLVFEFSLAPVDAACPADFDDVVSFEWKELGVDIVERFGEVNVVGVASRLVFSVLEPGLGGSIKQLSFITTGIVNRISRKVAHGSISLALRNYVIDSVL